MKAAVVLACGCGMALAPLVYADGALPPLPYRYVNPPAALSGENQPPLSGSGAVNLSSGRSLAVRVFTADGQTGIFAQAGAFIARRSAKLLRIKITPAPPPESLPDQLVADGNAYLFSAVTVPGGRQVDLARAVQITVRWPHAPVALYVRISGRWSRTCSARQSVLSSTTMTCAVPALGLVVAATTQANNRVSFPSSPAPWLSRYLPIISAAALVLLTAALGFWATRPDRQERDA
ncbi:MAG: hypothetical protein NVS2B16_00790 [Chloroflexota bacterium]